MSSWRSFWYNQYPSYQVCHHVVVVGILTIFVIMYIIDAFLVIMYFFCAEFLYYHILAIKYVQYVMSGIITILAIRYVL